MKPHLLEPLEIAEDSFHDNEKERDRERERAREREEWILVAQARGQEGWALRNLGVKRLLQAIGAR